MSGLGRGMPTSPFEIEATKDIIARRIEAGDIKQSDLDLLKKGYKWMTTASAAGSIGMALPTYIFLRRRRPPVGIGLRLLVAGGMGMLGSFLGFTVGGAAAAMEVNKGLENPQQKLKVFQEIAQEARRAALEHSGTARPLGSDPTTGSTNQRQRPLPSSSTPKQRESIGVETSPSTWASEANLDRMELDQESIRERSFDRDTDVIRGDSDFARNRDFNDERSSSFGTSSSASSGGIPRATVNEARGVQEGKQRGGEYGNDESTWDRLRQEGYPSSSIAGQNPNRTDILRAETGNRVGGKEGMAGMRAAAPIRSGGDAGGADGGKKVDERSREQREFDEMLDRERRGLGGNDKWA